jgi:hypothetical protein
MKNKIVSKIQFTKAGRFVLTATTSFRQLNPTLETH